MGKDNHPENQRGKGTCAFEARPLLKYLDEEGAEDEGSESDGN